MMVMIGEARGGNKVSVGLASYHSPFTIHRYKEDVHDSLRKRIHLILICAKPLVASPNPSEIPGPLERTEHLRGLRGPITIS